MTISITRRRTHLFSLYRPPSPPGIQPMLPEVSAYTWFSDGAPQRFIAARSLLGLRRHDGLRRGWPLPNQFRQLLADAIADFGERAGDLGLHQFPLRRFAVALELDAHGTGALANAGGSEMLR